MPHTPPQAQHLDPPKDVNLYYKSHPTISRFHHSTAFHRGIRGPRGSGKSTGCCIEIGRLASLQEPYFGLRQTRFGVVRNTYRELEDTTIKTWCRWYPEDHIGPINRATMTQTIRKQLPDDTMLECEIIFRALDTPKDVKKTLSLELTGAYINEAKEIPFTIISGLDDAIGRYPPRYPARGFSGPTWQGMILDTNAPDDDHWWFGLEQQYFSKNLDPKAWAFYVQPGGLLERDGRFYHNHKAENLENIGADYYLMRMVGKKKDHIRVYYCNQFGFVLDGKPVHPDYVDATHGATEILDPVKGVTIIVGMDFGLTPAAVFGQLLPSGRWIVIDEVVTANKASIDAKRFGGILKKHIAKEYPDFDFEFYGDPAGNEDAQSDGTTCFEMLAVSGIKAEPAIVKGRKPNDTEIRRGALDAPLTRMVNGKPGFLVSTKCKSFRKSLKGGWCYRKKQIAGTEQYHSKPDKNRYSHVGEAGEYMCIGGGEGDALIEVPEVPPEKETPVIVDHGDSGFSQGWMA